MKRWNPNAQSGGLHRPAPRPPQGRLSLFFRAEQWRGVIENCEPEKCDGWEWIATDSLPADIVPYAKYAITELLAGRRLGLFGWPDA